MITILRGSINLINKNNIIFRNFSRTNTINLKEISVTEQNNTLLIEGVTVSSPRDKYLLEEVKNCSTNGAKFCPACTLGLDIKHTDVLILSQYVRSDGCMLPRRVTGLCKRQQKKIGTMVTMAQKAGLMINLTPANSKKDPKKRYQWKKYNKYYDENTIKY